MKKISTILAYTFVALGLASMGSASAGVLSTLYVTSGDGSTGPRLVAIQNTSIQFTVVTPSLDLPIAVRDTIWLATYCCNTTAQEYGLNGVATGQVRPWTPLFGADGATDGINNYTMSSFGNTGTVYRGDGEWQGMASIFTASGGNDYNGITFDTGDGTLWLSDQNNVYQYSLGGTLLTQFSHSSGRGSLAWEQATDTLWYVTNNSNTITQYSETGTLLQTLNIAGLAGNNWGAEFRIGAAVPVPGSLALLGLGLFGLGWSRRRKA